MSTTATFEDEVRAMLARRAADVPDEGDLAPPLPTGLRIAVDDRPPADPRRTRWLAVAAAVVLLLGAAGLVVATAGDGTERAGTTDQASDPAAPRPEHLDRLPAGIDPTVGPVRAVGQPAPTPEEAADILMAETFGDDVTPNAPFEWGGDPAEVWAAYRAPLVELDPEAWPGATANDVTGTVTARRTDAGWSAVAVTNRALDLRDVRYDAEGLTGEVRAAAPVPLRVVVSSVTGERLATSDLTTTSPPDNGPSVLPLEGFDDLGDQPVVLRVEAGDRSGQIGFDGVRVAAISTVVLPATEEGATESSPPTTETGSEPISSSPVTTDPIATTAPAADAEGEADGTVAGLPRGLGVDELVPLWGSMPEGATPGPSEIVVWYLAERAPSTDDAELTTTEVATSDPDVRLVRWSSGPIDGPVGPGEEDGTVVVRDDPSGWVVVAALSPAFDLGGVVVRDGWATGEVTSSLGGEWAVGLAPRPGSLSLEQWQDLVGYLSTLDAGTVVSGGTERALGPMPTELPEGPITLLAAGPERDGEVPWAEVAFQP